MPGSYINTVLEYCSLSVVDAVMMLQNRAAISTILLAPVIVVIIAKQIVIEKIHAFKC